MLDIRCWIIAVHRAHRSHRKTQMASHHRKWDADFADGHGFHRIYRTIADCPQITQIDADSIAPSQGCITKNTKIDHRKAHKDIAIENGHRKTGTVSDFVVERSRSERD
jgi:hypothetical protein